MAGMEHDIFLARLSTLAMLVISLNDDAIELMLVLPPRYSGTLHFRSRIFLVIFYFMAVARSRKVAMLGLRSLMM